MFLRDYMHMRASEPREIRERNRELYQEYKTFMRNFSKAQEEEEDEFKDLDDDEKEGISQFEHESYKKDYTPEQIKQFKKDYVNSHRYYKARGKGQFQLDIMNRQRYGDSLDKDLRKYRWTSLTRRNGYTGKDRKETLDSMRTQAFKNYDQGHNEKIKKFLEKNGIKHFSFQ